VKFSKRKTNNLYISKITKIGIAENFPKRKLLLRGDIELVSLPGGYYSVENLCLEGIEKGERSICL
jgi:hypothetical protein